jgi:hypothetical protein
VDLSVSYSSREFAFAVRAIEREVGKRVLRGKREQERCFLLRRGSGGKSGAPVGGVSARKIVDLRQDPAMFGNFGMEFISGESSFPIRFAKVFFR